MGKILDPGKTFLDSVMRQSNDLVVLERSPCVRPREVCRRKGSDKDPSNSRIEPSSFTYNVSFCNSNGNGKKYASPHWPTAIGFDNCLSTHYLPNASLSRQFKSPGGKKRTSDQNSFTVYHEPKKNLQSQSVFVSKKKNNQSGDCG